MSRQISATTVHIDHDASLSAAGYLGGATLVGISMPAAFDAADLTFQASQDGVTYNELYDDAGNVVTVKADHGQHVNLVPSEWMSMMYLKVRSGTSGAAVAQTAVGGVDIILLTQEAQ